jgi:hypothetical protein
MIKTVRFHEIIINTRENTKNTPFVTGRAGICPRSILWEERSSLVSSVEINIV